MNRQNCKMSLFIHFQVQIPLLKMIIMLNMSWVLNAQSLTTIDLVQATFEEIPANRIFEELKIVPLETHPDGLLNIKYATYYLTDKYIIAITPITSISFFGSQERAYLFDRETGKFIREVSSFGQGPDEYTGFLYGLFGFDEKNNILFVSDAKYIGESCKGINIETNKVELIVKKPLNENPNETNMSSAPWLIKENIYVSFRNNRTGKDKVRLIVYDKDGSIIKRYPNYLEYEKIGGLIPAFNGIFYNYNKMTYFKEWGYNDTVFCVDEEKMLPHMIFKLGNKQPSYYHQQDGEYNKGKYLIYLVNESNSLVLFNFLTIIETRRGPLGESLATNSYRHTGYYDKKSKQAYISSTPDYKKSGITIPGLPVNFIPISINNNKEMIAHIDPEELMKYKNDISSQYKHLFQNIQEDDNPIIIIAKIKE